MSLTTDIAKKIMAAGKEAAVTLIVTSTKAALPILGVPVISQTFDWIVAWVSNRIYPYMEKDVLNLLIEIEVASEKRAYEKATTELKAILKSQQKSPEEVARLEKEFERRLADLIRIRP